MVAEVHGGSSWRGLAHGDERTSACADANLHSVADSHAHTSTTSEGYADTKEHGHAVRRILLVLMFLALFAVPAFAQTPTATPTAAYDFPNAPTQGQSVSGPSGQTLTWDGKKWVAVGGVGGNYAPLVNISGGVNNYAPINAPSFTGLTIASQMQVANTLSAPTASFGNTTIQSGGVLMLAGTAALYFNGVAPGGTCSAGNAVTSISATIVPTCSPIVTGGPFLPVASPTFTGTLTGPSATLGAFNLGSSGSWFSNGLTVSTVATFNNTTTFPDASSIVTSANNGTAGYVFGFNNSTGITIGVARTGSFPTINGKALILGQTATPALLLETTGYVPDGAIIYTTGTTGNEWITHNATYDGTNWTGWGNDAEIITFGNPPNARVSIFNNQALTVGQTYTPTETVQFNPNGLSLLQGNYWLTGRGVGMFASGAWTPQIYFGGSSAGWACTTCNGVWTWSGQNVTLSFVMALGPKGTSTGAATVQGFPSNMGANAGSNHYGVCVNLGGMSIGTGYVVLPQMAGSANSYVMLMADNANTGSLVALNDGNFTGYTNLQCTISYMTQQ